MGRGSSGSKKKIVIVLGWILLVVYLLTLSYFVFFSEYYGRTSGNSEYRYNLHLFREIKRFYEYRYELGFETVIINLVGNVLVFMPLGIILPVIQKRKASFLRIFLTSFSFSLVIETLQLLFRVGTFDVDDLLLNTLGGILGYGIYSLWKKVKKNSNRK